MHVAMAARDKIMLGLRFLATRVADHTSSPNLERSAFFQQMQTRVYLPRSTAYTACRVRNPRHLRLVTTMVATKDQLTAAKAELTTLIKDTKCSPIMIRLAWHDSGSYNKVCVICL